MQAWQQYSIDDLLSSLGFSTTKYVEGRSSIADLFRSNRCGIYVLHFAYGDYYVGQAVDVVRRYAQHRKKHTDIQKISFKRASKKRLSEEERTSIRAFESCNFRLRNIQIVTFTYGETDFDLVMHPDEQTRWLDDVTFQDLDGSRLVDPFLRQKYAKSYHRLRQLPLAEEIIQVLHEYVRNSIPAVKRGEIAFWMCSCLPGNSNNLYSRINVSWQTTFEAWVVDNAPLYRWCVTRTLAEEAFGLSLSDVNDQDDMVLTGFENRPNMEIVVGLSGLTAGGQDQVWINAGSSQDALALIRDGFLLSAFRLFNLGLAQKGSCPWGPNHCLDLADRLIE